MPAVTISVTDHQRAFLEGEVQQGGYSNVSEVVRAALRLLEQQKQEQQARLRDLRLLIDAGDASGAPEPLEDLDGFLRRARERYAARQTNPQER